MWLLFISKSFVEDARPPDFISQVTQLLRHLKDNLGLRIQTIIPSYDYIRDSGGFNGVDSLYSESYYVPISAGRTADSILLLTGEKGLNGLEHSRLSNFVQDLPLKNILVLGTDTYCHWPGQAQIMIKPIFGKPLTITPERAFCAHHPFGAVSQCLLLRTNIGGTIQDVAKGQDKYKLKDPIDSLVPNDILGPSTGSCILPYTVQQAQEEVYNQSWRRIYGLDDE